MSLPDLKNSLAALRGLHRGALLIGAVQRLTQPPQPIYLELGLELQASGLASGALPAGGRVSLDLANVELVYFSSGNAKASFPLKGKSQAGLFAELFGTLEAGELASILPPGADLFERVSQGIAARGSRYHPPKREVLLDAAPIQIDTQAGRDYLEAIQAIFTGIARFQAYRIGLKTPLVVWPEHFDLSTLMFVGNQVDEAQPHLNFGFAPFSDGIDYPYLYAYGYPYRPHYQVPNLPSGTHWHTQGWTGAVLPYDIIADQSDSAAFVEASCKAIDRELRSIVAA